MPKKFYNTSPMSSANLINSVRRYRVKADFLSVFINFKSFFLYIIVAVLVALSQLRKKEFFHSVAKREYIALQILPPSLRNVSYTLNSHAGHGARSSADNSAF